MAKKKRSVVKILLIVVALLAIFAFIGFKAGWFGKGDITKVAVDVVKEMDVDELVSASGKIQPEIEVKLSSEVSGEVVELNIKEGDVVKKVPIIRGNEFTTCEAGCCATTAKATRRNFQKCGCNI